MRFFVRSWQGEAAERMRFRDAIFAAVKAARRGGMAIVGAGAPDAEDEAVMAAYKRWQRKYGDEEWAPLPAEDVYQLLEEIAQPAQLGLEPIRRGLFGRQVNSDIIQLLRFAPYKGYSYGFQWGVSLSFVPHDFDRTVRRVRFHRTLKSAKPDLFEDAADEFARRGRNERNGFIPAGYGIDVFRRDANATWEFVRPHVEDWFALTATVEGALARAREQEAAPGVPRHWPDPTLVAAFALARLGRDAEAQAELDDWLATRGTHIGIGANAAGNLVAALQKARPSAHGY